MAATDQISDIFVLKVLNSSNGVKRFRDQGRVEAMLNDSINKV